ncbi:TPA: GIY-YIG nuclease family protein [Vibrio vulnificus]|nr:GIY-YIG nuclease family protein [Vibrio vulnificus]HDY8072183.1 GIY-YIG nuclease family protein [Vibrio vulnificus]
MNEIGIVYFLYGEVTGLVKIGWTRASLVRRINQLQTGSPDQLRLLGIMRGTQAFEKELHAKFKPNHKHLEWFELSGEILRFIGSECLLFGSGLLVLNRESTDCQSSPLALISTQLINGELDKAEFNELGFNKYLIRQL